MSHLDNWRKTVECIKKYNYFKYSSTVNFSALFDNKKLSQDFKISVELLKISYVIFSTT